VEGLSFRVVARYALTLSISRSAWAGRAFAPAPTIPGGER